MVSKPLPLTACFCAGCYVRGTRYTFGRQLGTGFYSTVQLGISKATGERVAVKIIPRTVLGGALQEQVVLNEINVLKTVHHAHCTRCTRASNVCTVQHTMTCLVLFLE